VYATPPPSKGAGGMNVLSVVIPLTPFKGGMGSWVFDVFVFLMLFFEIFLSNQ
jgi:hypothetical protein